MRLSLTLSALWLLASFDVSAAPAPSWFRPGNVAVSARGLRYVVATVRHPLSESERAQLNAAGAELLALAPGRGYSLRVAPGAEAAVRRLPFVASVAVAAPESKIDPGLMTAVGVAAPTPLRVVLAAGEPNDRVVAALAGLDVLAAPSGKDGAWRIVATLPPEALAAALSTLASLPEVEGIEAVHRIRPLNQDAIWVHQSFVGP